MLESVANLPDHGHGGLGQVAHGALTAHPPCDTLYPRLFLGYNTMPDPPFPMTGYLPWDTDPRVWAAVDDDPAAYLKLAAASLRAQPVPPRNSFDDARQRLAALMRVDALVLVTTGRLLVPQENEASRALLANLAEGFYRDGDAEACVGARESGVAVAVDRAGWKVALVAPRKDSGEYEAPFTGDGATAGVLLDLLADVLDAQYSWTRAAFAL